MFDIFLLIKFNDFFFSFGKISKAHFLKNIGYGLISFSSNSIIWKTANEVPFISIGENKFYTTVCSIDETRR